MSEATMVRSKVAERIEWPFEEIFDRHILVQISKFSYSGRIIIPDAAQKFPTRGHVVMVGKGIDDIKEGQMILYSQFAGYLLIFEGLPPCRIINRDEVLARLKPDAPALSSEAT